MRLDLAVAAKNPELSALYKRAIIKVNGVQMKNCTTADEEKGFVIAYMVDAKGKLIFVKGKAKTIMLKGKVEIIDPLEQKANENA